MTAPCYKCPDRSAGCHADCAAYKAYRREMDAFARYLDAHKPIDTMHTTHSMEQKNRRRKCKGGKQ